MAKDILHLTVTGVLAMFLVCSATLKIRNCTNNILDVLEPGPHEIYCDGVDGSVTGSGGTQSFPVAAVAGGVAASVLAIIVVIVIVLVIRRKCYRTYDRPNHRRDQDSNPYTGLRPTGAAANGNSGDVNTEGVYEEINPEQRQHPST
ncbi:hypothetical protein BaRGS_00011685, partial [Batillaria attramentaria]